MKTVKQLIKVTALAVMMLVSSVNRSSAQYDIGTNVLSAGIGIGGTYLGSYSGSNVSRSPGIALSYEHGTWELGDGIVSIGGYLGYKSIKDSYSSPNYSATWKWTYTIVGVRGAYHFTSISNDKLDLYLGLMLSYNVVNFKYTNSDVYYYNLYNNNYSYPSEVGFSAFGGIRYYLSDNIALNAELGYGVAYLTLGASFKL